HDRPRTRFRSMRVVASYEQLDRPPVSHYKAVISLQARTGGSSTVPSNEPSVRHTGWARRAGLLFTACCLIALSACSSVVRKQGAAGTGGLPSSKRVRTGHLRCSGDNGGQGGSTAAASAPAVGQSGSAPRSGSSLASAAPGAAGSRVAT